MSDLAITLLSKLLVLFVLVVAHALLPLFDASPRLVQPQSWLLQPFIRWDSLHFQAIADTGYLYENQWAFLPGTPFLVRLLGLWWPAVLLLLACDSTRTLYNLTRFHFPASPALARLVALLSLLPSSPATLYFAPYAEPFFTYLSYKGMLFAAKQQWLLATLCFAVACMFRSNGVLLGGYLVWGLVVQPFIIQRSISLLKILYSILLTSCVVSPFVYHNYSAYRLFCFSAHPAEWCSHLPPSIYPYIQAKYWGSGFMRYWTLSQTPNFAIATPPLTLLVIFSVQHLGSFGFGDKVVERHSPFTSLAIVPYLIHTLAMCVTLLFFSHTQITLRLAAALPPLYWGTAWLMLRDSEAKQGQWRWGTLWVGWSVVWGLISLGLWAAFLPPA